MQKTTILLGPAGSGKSHTAREMAKGKKHLLLEYGQLYHKNDKWISPFAWKGVCRDTELIIIDEWTGSIHQIKELIYSDFIRVEKQGYDPFEMRRPEMIIISQIFKKSDFIERPGLEIIECNYLEEGHTIHFPEPKSISTMYFKLIKSDTSDYMLNRGRGHVKNLYEAEVPGGKVYKSEFQRIENEDHVVLHSESMVFIPDPAPNK